MNETTTHNGDNSPQTGTETDHAPVNNIASVNNATGGEALRESAKPPHPVILRRVAQPLKSLRERGISAQTKRQFGIEDLIERGLCYKTQYLDGQAGPLRFKGMVAGIVQYTWLAEKLPERLPLLYNAAVLKDEEWLQHGVFLVQGEADVWPMHQSGLAAIALFGVSEEENQSEEQSETAQTTSRNISSAALEELAHALKNHKPHKQPALQLLFDHDAQGRLWALQAHQALRQHGIACQMPTLQSWPDAPLGFSVSELFEAVDFNEAQMREAIAMLQLVTRREMERWENDPTVGLPAASKLEDKLLPCLDEAALEALPESRFLIENLILAESVTLLTGKENLGKSAIAIALAATVSLGIAWQGQATTPGLAFYLAAEGQGGIRKRLQACKQSLGVSSTPNFLTLPLSLHLQDAKARERLIKTIEYATAKAREEALSNGVEPPAPALLVIDTLAKTRGTLDENSPNDMTLYLEAAAEIAKRTSLSILILHHNNRNDAFRGSSALTANADAHLMLLGESGGDEVTLKVAKLKDFSDGQQYVLRKRVIDLGMGDNGKAQTSVVFERDPEAEAEREGADSEEQGLSPKAKTSLRVLMKLCRENNGEGISSSEWFKTALQQGVAKPTFDRAKRALLAAEAITCQNAGTPSARFAPNPTFKL